MNIDIEMCWPYLFVGMWAAVFSGAAWVHFYGRKFMMKVALNIALELLRNEVSEEEIREAISKGER